MESKAGWITVGDTLIVDGRSVKVVSRNNIWLPKKNGRMHGVRLVCDDGTELICAANKRLARLPVASATATAPAPAPVVICTAYAAGYADLTIDGVAYAGVSVGYFDGAYELDTIGNPEAVEDAYHSGALSEAIAARVAADDDSYDTGRGWREAV